MNPAFRCRWGGLPGISAALLCFPRQAWANAGTPLMWAGIFHLLIGNALIGLLEALILEKGFRVPRSRAAGAMVLANYFSAWIGLLVILPFLAGRLPMDLSLGRLWFWLPVAVSFVVTLLLEWPFVAWLLRREPCWPGRSVRACLLVQTVSYLMLAGGFWMTSDSSLFTEAAVVAPEELALPGQVRVYFIDPADGNVYERGLSGGEKRLVAGLPRAGRAERLVVRRPAGGRSWELAAVTGPGPGGEAEWRTLLQGLDLEAAPEWSRRPGESERILAFGEAARLAQVRQFVSSQRGFWRIPGAQLSGVVM